MLVSIYRAIIFIVLVIKQADFSSGFTADRAFGIFIQQFFKCCDSLATVACLYIRTAFFIKSIYGIGWRRIFVCHAVEQCNLTIIIFLQAGNQSQLIERIITCRSSHIFCFGIILLGFIETACVQMTVAYAIVSICECSGIFSFFQLCEFQETVLGKCVIFLMKSYVGQIIVCQCISFCISVRSKI